MNLLIYLVYGTNKTFDMQSMKVFCSLEAFKFFLMGLLKMCGYVNAPKELAG